MDSFAHKRPISAIVLASGLSNRFGYNKLLMPYNDTTIIEHCLNIITKFDFNEIILVTTTATYTEIKQNIDKNIKVIINKEPSLGKSSSIKLGTKNSNIHNDYMFFVADNPFMNSNTVSSILSTYDSLNKNSDVLHNNFVIRPCYNNIKGNPCLFSKSLRDNLLSLTGDEGGVSIIKTLNNDITQQYVKANDIKELSDIDTPSDYFKALGYEVVIVRGGGDIATGVIQKLHRAGFKVLVLETKKPTSIRRKVCVSEAIYESVFTVEDITAKKVSNIKEIAQCFNEGLVPIYIDESCDILQYIKPLALVDAILAKKNLGTTISQAPIVIALGPPFCASTDCHIVVETMRGHNLGRLIFNGKALPNTGIPSPVLGVSTDRVIYSSVAGQFKSVKKIGDVVEQGEVIGMVDNTPIIATISGVIRGMIRDDFFVKENLKIIDIDPRLETKPDVDLISDKARCIGGSVLEAIMLLKRTI